MIDRSHYLRFDAPRPHDGGHRFCPGRAGRASILGPVFGALLLTVLLNGLTTLGVSQYYQPLSVGVVVVAAAFLMRFQK